jgi:sigma-B regulation protein RsbU (phosphoserine phosphatase)
MSELISLLDLTTTLSTGLSNEEILDAALLIVMGELQVSRGCLLVRVEGQRFGLRASRGLPAGAPTQVAAPVIDEESVITTPGGPEGALFEAFGLEVLCPIRKQGRMIAILGLGARANGEAYGAEERGFLRSVAACAATPIENGLIHHELRRVNQRLSVKVFQLNNLFDISRELTASFDEGAIQSLVTATLMGQLMASRCALYVRGPQGFAAGHSRGLRSEEGFVTEEEARPLVEALRAPLLLEDLPRCPLHDRLAAARIAMVVPLGLGGRVEGFLAVGERVSGGSFTEEDRDFAMTLARQAQAALESVRLHRVKVEKQRQDREMQIAREIQQSLFPTTFPKVAGFDVFAESQPCYQVGGDHFDVISLGEGKIALAIADVSGKGAPASLLMASVHAWLRALAGTETPRRLIARLNQFLFENTQENRYVTLFYAELDAVARSLAYVNAGHIPPYWTSPAGETARLTDGGPVLGLLEDAAFEEGRVTLGIGDCVAMVTDGVTEAESESAGEFGDDRVLLALREAAPRSAADAVAAIGRAVQAWMGDAKASDDLTILALKAS